MTRKLFTIEEFRAEAKKHKESSGLRMNGTVVRLATSEPELDADEDSRKIRFIFSDGSVDRSGDTIDAKGWDTTAFESNPVALWCHDSSAPPVGRASDVGPTKGKLVGDIEFMTAEISPFADSIYRMVKGGFLKAVSVGFMPVEWKFVSDNDRPYGIDFLKQELLEISVCPVPCNPNALQEAKSMGIDTGPLREWASKVLDEGGHILVPRGLLEETFRQAKTPPLRSRLQKYLAKSETPEWKVGADHDLPLDNQDSWDGPAAAKRILDEAGFDGDNPDAAKAAKGFLLHDAANPSLRGSYKLPFADIVGGELKAIKAGISAAKGRLDQTDAPADILNEAKGIIDAYETKFEGKTFEAPPLKAGRRISSANEAKLKEAMGLHAAATKCIEDVLSSNAASADDSDDGDDAGNDMIIIPPVITETVDPVAKRIAEAKALRASLNL